MGSRVMTDPNSYEEKALVEASQMSQFAGAEKAFQPRNRQP